MTSTDTPKDKDMFRSIGELAEDEEFDGVSVIKDSLCMECGGSGDTRMMTTKIPFFREIILCSFECNDCNGTNNEVTFGGEIQEKGIRYVLEARNKEDMNRSVIKADSATVSIPSLEFEIPARSQKGGITTVEGLLSKAVENLSMYQTERMAQDPASGAAVALVIVRLQMMLQGDQFPFKMIVDDPSGNSFVENLKAPKADPQLNVSKYERTPMQDIAVGLQPSASVRDQLNTSNTYIDDNNATHKAVNAPKFDGIHDMLYKFGEVSVHSNPSGSTDAKTDTQATTSATTTATDPSQAYNEDGTPNEEEDISSSLGRREIIRMPTNCPHCNTPGESLTCFADIPHFKEIIIMAFDCSMCGYRSNEVKGGGGVPAKGQMFTLVVESSADLSRDVLKSSSCDVIIPELELEASQGSLGGVFTSVEGLLKKVHTAMLDSTPYMMGDSAQDNNRKTVFRTFTDKFAAIAEGRMFPFTLQLRDPLANSFIGTLYDKSPEEDKQLTVSDYARTFDEDDELGLHDIDVGDDNGGGYASEDAASKAAAAAAAAEIASGTPNPNRALTHKRWGPDHPHNFAKGCDDNTQSTPISESSAGDYETSTSVSGSGASLAPLTVPLEVVATPPNPPAADDENFTGASKFNGAKPGFVFKHGDKGVGYYRDSA